MDRPQTVPVEELIHFFVDRLSERIGRTALMKLLYFADLEARRYLGAPITSLRYVFYTHGPFDKELYPAKDHLIKGGLIEEEPLEVSNLGVEQPAFRLRVLKPHPTGVFSPGHQAILDYVVETFGGRAMTDLLDLAYSTRPMLAVTGQGGAHGTRLPMELVDFEASRELGGLSIECVLRGEEDIRRGRVHPWDGIRDQILGHPE